MDDFLFGVHSQSDIDNVMKYCKEDGTSYNWEQSNVESVSELLVIDIKTLDDGEFQFYQTELIRKVSEFTGMEHCNGLLTPTKVEAPLGIDTYGYEDKRYWPNSYVSVIGMLLYLTSNSRPYISYVVHQCDQFKNNTRESHETAVKMICRYLQGSKQQWFCI